MLLPETALELLKHPGFDLFGFQIPALFAEALCNWLLASYCGDVVGAEEARAKR
jgi:hypothetical protein